MTRALEAIVNGCSSAPTTARRRRSQTNWPGAKRRPPRRRCTGASTSVLDRLALAAHAVDDVGALAREQRAPHPAVGEHPEQHQHERGEHDAHHGVGDEVAQPEDVQAGEDERGPGEQDVQPRPDLVARAGTPAADRDEPDQQQPADRAPAGLRGRGALEGVEQPVGWLRMATAMWMPTRTIARVPSQRCRPRTFSTPNARVSERTREGTTTTTTTSRVSASRPRPTESTPSTELPPPRTRRDRPGPPRGRRGPPPTRRVLTVAARGGR